MTEATPSTSRAELSICPSFSSGGLNLTEDVSWAGVGRDAL